MQDIHNTVIVRSDGGICSQIAFYLLGRYLEDKGFKVKYDLSWFEMFGCDLNHKFVRNYDMDKAFPDLKIEVASPEEIKCFQEKYLLAGSVKNCKAPAYITGYPPERDVAINLYIHYLKKYFKPADADSVEDIVQEMSKNVSCGVHVRRGDLPAGRADRPVRLRNAHVGHPAGHRRSGHEHRRG